jgi:hypothetical protein
MATRVDVDVTVFEGSIREIARGPELHSYLRRAVDEVAEGMRSGAPVRSGAGRASIRGQVHMGPDGWYGTASWDTRHYYMGILNSRRQFAEPAIMRVRYV